MAFLPPVPGGPQPGLGSLVAGAPPAGAGPAGQTQTPNLPQMGDPMAANEGAIQFLRSIELRIEELSQDILKISEAYPTASADSRSTLDALGQAKQSLTGFLVSMVSQMQSPQPQAPRYGAL